MKSGALNQRIILERMSGGVDALGQPLPDEWAPLGVCWAAVLPLQGREYIAAQAVQSDVTTRIVIRFRPGITTADRVKHEGRIYNITSVIDTRSQHDRLELMCRG